MRTICSSLVLCNKWGENVAKYGSGMAYETGIYGQKIDPPTLSTENNNLVVTPCVIFGE